MASVSPRHVASGDHSASFVELFFDLVFVYSVTQVVGLLGHGGGWTVAAEAATAFWLVWWAWTQFTWALNSANAEDTRVELAVLVATGVAFFMAIALPDAFHGRGLLFAVCYVAVRGIGLGLYAWIAAHDPRHHAAVRRFTGLSLLGLGAVLAGGLLGGPAMLPLFAVAVILDVFAATLSTRIEGWDLRPAHFGERHGLFVIIALGETLIVAANSVGTGGWTSALLLDAALAATLAGALWWTYFARARPLLERELARRSGAERAGLARDVYSLLHFPVICGIVAFAVALEVALAHPEEPLPTGARAALAAGVLLFIGGMALALWRAVGHLPRTRVGIALGTAGVVLAVPGLPTAVSLALAAAGAATVGYIEQRSGCYRRGAAAPGSSQG